MPFIRAARDFLNNPNRHENHPHYTVMRDTIDFLLNNAIGLSNAVPTRRIIEHLNNLGHEIHREKWQVEILGYLRENGVFIGSKVGLGIFLIENRNDALEAYHSIQRRVRTERRRLSILEDLIGQAGWNI